MRRAIPALSSPFPAILAVALLAQPAPCDRMDPTPLFAPSLTPSIAPNAITSNPTIPEALRPPLPIAHAEPVRNAYSAWVDQPGKTRHLASYTARPINLASRPARDMLDILDEAWILADEGFMATHRALQSIHASAMRSAAASAARLAVAAGRVATVARSSIPSMLALKHPAQRQETVARPPLIAVLPLAIVLAADAHGLPLLVPHAGLAWAEVRLRHEPVRPAPTFSFLGMGPHGTLDAQPHDDTVLAE